MLQIACQKVNDSLKTRRKPAVFDLQINRAQSSITGVSDNRIAMEATQATDDKQPDATAS